MRFLDSTFLIDYADAGRAGHDDAVAYLEANESAPFAAPTLVLYELYRGAARIGRDPGDVAEDFDWIEPVAFTDAAAREAARIYAGLLDRGEPVNAADVLIAGTVRDAGGSLVTSDADFERIEGLDVVRYDA